MESLENNTKAYLRTVTESLHDEKDPKSLNAIQFGYSHVFYINLDTFEVRAVSVIDDKEFCETNSVIIPHRLYSEAEIKETIDKYRTLVDVLKCSNAKAVEIIQTEIDMIASNKRKKEQEIKEKTPKYVLKLKREED